ncbi:hypothetical protein [Chitinophaga sp. HK235]|uniref:hypothetical protein n=1 Tax=Chitinophaga sp. HK235 TaxID=2952571 RepID=UPI001BABFD47|nr:hypothetical protein [Chitinophaga sp. HK235]
MSNKRVDFGNLGGFPLTQDVLAYMQSSYRDALTGLARVCGNKVIVSGMSENGTIVADGWILHDGELLPFVGGPKQNTYIIIDDNKPVTFEDGVSRTVLFNRYARFGSGGFPYSDLVRLDSMASLKDNIATLNNNLSTLNANFLAHRSAVNPHGMTKADVGLGNIPNAISSDPASNNPAVLATTAALAAANRFLLSGTIDLPDIDRDLNIRVWFNRYIYDSYIVVGSLRSRGYWNDDNDCHYTVKNLDYNGFDLLIRENSTDNQRISFDYLIIKR